MLVCKGHIILRAMSPGIGQQWNIQGPDFNASSVVIIQLLANNDAMGNALF
jgi:hypothetical protein